MKLYFAEVLMLICCFYCLVSPFYLERKLLWMLQEILPFENGELIMFTVLVFSFFVYIVFTSPYRIWWSMLLFLISGLISLVVLIPTFFIIAFKDYPRGEGFNTNVLIILFLAITVIIKLGVEKLLTYFKPVIQEKAFLKAFYFFRTKQYQSN